jgi:hypothetical protein
MNTKESLSLLAAIAVLLTLAACASPEKAPAAADVALPHGAKANADQARAAERAPDEIASAREKMLKANQALAAKDYKQARELAVQAEADARLAQSKATSAKATAAANAQDTDLHPPRQDVDRANQ